MTATFTPTPYHRGRLMQALEARRLIRARSPRARAGRVGGIITAHLHPVAARPRDASGRFAKRKEGQP